MKALPPDVEDYLKDLKLGLAPLGSPDREEILAEVRSHFEERLAQGRARVLDGFLPAERYAASFLAERSLASALAEGTPWALSRSLWIGRVERAFALAAAVPLGLLQLCAVTLVVLGALKPLFFERIGLWLGPQDRFALGYLSDPGARELLGWWVVPLFIGGGALIFILAHRAQTALARRRLRLVRAASVPR
jgi:uncharacterized membrane protein